MRRQVLGGLIEGSGPFVILNEVKDLEDGSPPPRSFAPLRMTLLRLAAISATSPLLVILLLGSLLLAATSLPAATGTRILLVARDLEERPLAGFRFTYGGVKSEATNDAGATELDLPVGQPTGQPIKIQLVPSSKGAEEWFLVNPLVNAPSGTTPAEIVLMRRSTLRQIAAALSGTPRVTIEDRKRYLVDAAAHHGLTAEQLERAVRSFAETQDSEDRGIAAYLNGQLPQAEELLNKAAEKKGSDLDTLRYLGVTQYEQAKFRAAAETFRKALALRGEDTVLLSWLGSSLHELAEWSEAQKLMRRALAIDEKSFGTEHPTVAQDLNNLASLLQATNRPAEAEPLMRRALAIDEKSFGAEDPRVALLLSNLAALLYATNRLAEAEPLMRRALDIDEKSFGLDHPEVAIRLSNLAQLLQATNRLAEAEPLIRQALAIGEKSFGAEDPRVALLLSNLAALLYATNRLAEAEPLMRRGLTILLEFRHHTGHEHPNEGMASSNYRSLLKRMGKSDAEIQMTIDALVRSPK